MGCMTFGLVAMAGVESRPKRHHVDFASVPPSQWKMHDRLENWARWARGSDKQSGVAATPMFSLYRSSEAKRAHGSETSIPVDIADAMRVAKAVGHLPPKKRKAIHWHYLHPRNPVGAARELDVTMQELADLVRDGRTMLIMWVGV